MRQKLSFAQVQSRRPGPAELASRPRMPVVAVLDNVRSLNNVGSIFRTADGVRLEELVLCGITGSPPRNEIRKTSLGAEESVPWRKEKSAIEAASGYRRSGYQIAVLEHTTFSMDYRRAAYRFPLCLIVGHEFHGVSQDLVKEADIAIEIPMHGVKVSLNVSVAFGVAVYEIMTHWQKDSGYEEAVG